MAQAAVCELTLSQLGTRILARLDNNSGLYTTRELNAAINESLNVVNLVTGYHQQTFTMTSVANRLLYDLPQGAFIPLRIQLGDFYLQKTGLAHIGERTPAWQMDTALTTGKAPTEWVPYGIRRFALHPADSAGGVTMLLTAVAEIPRLSNPTDIIPIQTQYLDMLIDVATHIAQVKEGGKILADSMTLYRRAVSKLKKMSAFQTERMPFFVPEATQVGIE